MSIPPSTSLFVQNINDKVGKEGIVPTLISTFKTLSHQTDNLFPFSIKTPFYRTQTDTLFSILNLRQSYRCRTH